MAEYGLVTAKGTFLIAKLIGKVNGPALAPEAPLPAPDHRPADPDAGGNLLNRQPIGGAQNDPSALRVLGGVLRSPETAPNGCARTRSR